MTMLVRGLLLLSAAMLLFGPAARAARGPATPFARLLRPKAMDLNLEDVQVSACGSRRVCVTATGRMLALMDLVWWAGEQKARLHRGHFDLSKAPWGTRIPASLTFAFGSQKQAPSVLVAGILRATYRAGLQVTRFRATPKRRQLELHVEAQGARYQVKRLRRELSKACAGANLKCSLRLVGRAPERFQAKRISQRSKGSAQLVFNSIRPGEVLYLLGKLRSTSWVLAAPPKGRGPLVSGALDPALPFADAARALGLSSRRLRGLQMLTFPGASVSGATGLAARRGRRGDATYLRAPVGEVARALAAVEQNLVFTPEIFKRRVSLQLSNMPILRVVDAVARASNLRVHAAGLSLVLSSKALLPLDHCPETATPCRPPKIPRGAQQVDLRARAATLGDVLALLSASLSSPEICGELPLIDMKLKKVKRRAAIELALRAAGAVRVHIGGGIRITPRGRPQLARGSCRKTTWARTQAPTLDGGIQLRALVAEGGKHRLLATSKGRSFVVDQGSTLMVKVATGSFATRVARVSLDAIFLQLPSKRRTRIPFVGYSVDPREGSRGGGCGRLLLPRCPPPHLRLLGTLTGMRNARHRALIGCWGDGTVTAFRGRYLTSKQHKLERVARGKVLMSAVRKKGDAYKQRRYWLTLYRP
jgi:hypothetical protein